MSDSGPERSCCSRPGSFTLLRPTVVTKEHRRNAAFHRELFCSFFDVLNVLSSREVFVDEVASDVWTADGVKLAEAFGMTEAGKLKDNPKISIYSAHISSILGDYIPRKGYPKLLDRYKALGLMAASR